jgi:chitin disaccharide deacetylase
MRLLFAHRHGTFEEMTVEIRNFILNADDYALNAGADAAILDLAGRGIVTSASAMVLSPRWKEAGRALAPCPISRGLHLDFTSPFASTSFSELSIGKAVVRAYCGLTGGEAIRRRIGRQLSLYEEVLGEAPQFIDGHRHIHQLPGIRTALLACLKQRYGREAPRVKIRFCIPARWRGLEAALVGATGATALKRLASIDGFSGNTDFAGVYSFAKGSPLKHLWRSWLVTLAGAQPMIVCHPAKAANETLAVPDKIAETRKIEYEWLKSEEFRDLLSETGRVPASWSSERTS